MKKRIVTTLLFATTLATMPMLQSCVVAAVGAGIGAAKYGGGKQKQAYASYRTEMERLNFEREKAGLKTAPIMTYDDWRKGKT